MHRAAPAIQPPSSPAPTASAPNSAGSRSSTISRRSSPTRSLGSACSRACAPPPNKSPELDFQNQDRAAFLLRDGPLGPMYSGLPDFSDRHSERHIGHRLQSSAKDKWV